MVAFIPGRNGGRRNKEKSCQIGEVLLTKCELVWEIRNMRSPGHREGQHPPPHTFSWDCTEPSEVYEIFC